MDISHQKRAEERIPAVSSTVAGAGLVAFELAAGAAAGALTGAIAGPPGAAIGAVLGAVVGVAAGGVLVGEEHAKQVADEALDREIGVIGGTIGEETLEHPPSSRGIRHLASLGLSADSTSAPSAGPMQNVDAD